MTRCITCGQSISLPPPKRIGDRLPRSRSEVWEHDSGMSDHFAVPGNSGEFENSEET